MRQSKLKYETHRGNAPLPKELAALAKARRDARIQTYEQAIELRRLSQWTDEELALRRKAREYWMAAVATPEQLERLSRERMQKLEQIRALNSHAQMPAVQLPSPSQIMDSPVSDRGQLWWAESEWNTSDPEIVMFNDAEGFHIGGEYHWQLGALYQGHVELNAQFGLGPDRMPDGNRFYSAPVILIDGALFGSAESKDLFSGDQWSKCWLNTKQEVLATGGGPDAIILGSNSQSTQLINVDFTGFGGGGQITPLSGVRGLPPVEFQLDDFSKSIGMLVEITVNFTYQLEGDDALIKFSSFYSPRPLLLQTFQWTLQPV